MARDADVAGGGGNRRLDRLDILAGDVGRRRPDTGVLGAAGNEPAVAGRSTQSVMGTWVIEVTQFKSEVTCDLRGHLEAAITSETTKKAAYI